MKTTMMLEGSHGLRNTTDKWVVVSNAREVVASFDSFDEAQRHREEARRGVSIGFNRHHGGLRVMGPGEEWTVKMPVLRPRTAAEEAASEAAFERKMEELFGVR